MPHHPSTQGMPGGGQPGVTMGQPMHPGMVAPGMPQVSQPGPNMGMIPGGGPQAIPGAHLNAHAMQHLNPNGNQMIPAQQMASTYHHLFPRSSDALWAALVTVLILRLSLPILDTSLSINP